MSYYRGTADGPEKAKAIAAVLLVHIGLGAAILTGLNSETVTRTVESITIFDLEPETPPPPPPPPPPQPRPSAPAKLDQGAAGKKAEPSPIVASKPRIILPATPPVAEAPDPGQGSASTSGAADAGTGPGAGGQGSGRGGGGTGIGGTDYSRYTPAQRISRIPNREYRRLVAASGRSRGTVGITLKVNTDGRPSNCRIARSSGDPNVDALMCGLALAYVRFRPARDDRGQPVAQDITWFPDWAPN